MNVAGARRSALALALIKSTHDRRLGGRWTRRQAAKNWCIAQCVRAAFTLADRLPAGALSALGRFLGRCLRAASPRALGRARASAARCLDPDRARQASFRCFERAGENLAASLLLRRPLVRALDWVDVPERSRRVLTTALSEGRGAVFVSAHLGPFELLPAVIAELGLRPAIVVRESYDPRLDPWVDRHRHARGVDVIHRGAPGAAMRIVRALRAGQPVGFLPDLGARVPQIATNFLGRSTGFAVGPQQIAQRMRVPLVVGALRRVTDGSANAAHERFVLSIERVDTRGTVAALTRRVAQLLERSILSADEDFPWMALSENVNVSAGVGEPASAGPSLSGESRIADGGGKALCFSTTSSSESEGAVLGPRGAEHREPDT
jgi:lauroyl/myristoyl acyltransferase